MKKSAMHPCNLKPVFAAAAIGLVFVGAVPCHAASLQDAYAAAVAYDPKFQSALRERDAGQEAREQGRAGLLPEVSLGVNVARNQLDRRIGLLEDQPRYQSDSTVLQVRQAIFNREAVARFNQGAAQAQFAEAVLVARRRELMLRMLEAYTRVLLVEEQVTLARAQVSVFESQLQSSERLRALGEGTLTDVYEARASLELAAAQLLEANAARENVVVELQAIISPRLTPVPQRLPSAMPLIELDPEERSGWEQRALRANADIEARKQGVEMARQEVRRTEAGHYPRLDAVASASRSTSDSVNTLNQQYSQRSVGLQLNVPLYSGGKTTSLVRQAVANLGKAEADLADTTQAVLVDVRRQYNAVISGAQKIRALEQAVATTLLQVEATRKSVTGGVRVTLDVLNAEQQVYKARRDLADARNAYLNAWLRLRAVAGQLEPTDLNQIERHLAPDQPGGLLFAGNP